MATLTEQFGHKQPGELIKSKDWNGLIEAIDKLGDTLTTEITDLRMTCSRASKRWRMRRSSSAPTWTR